ncbi:MAG: acetyl-CoA hydrolase/transferase C-terminal domain-containing protein [Rhizomicrobium sp.]
MTPKQFTDPNAIADAIVADVGRDIVLALPLGLGKANHIVNALYARAAADRSIRLKIFTALSLEKPHYANVLERRFLEPVIERLFADYPALAYVRGLRDGTLPPNVDVNEFFFLAGRWLNVANAQQNYISANYTHAARTVIARGVNVIGQLVAKRERAGVARYALSCNTDMTLDLLKARAEGAAKFVLVGQVNSELPFMPGAGNLPRDEFHAILDSPATDHVLFAPPQEPIGLPEYATGLHVARLIPDGGTLQIGIGEEGDASVQGLILRQTQNALFREAVTRLSPDAALQPFHEDAPFVTGLYGTSEMFVDGFLQLIKAGVLKREVDGALLHAAFFLGPKSFYRALRDMPEADLAKLQMTAVSFTNELYGDEDRKRAARVKARFVNSTMMATLLGALVSDGLEDGRVVSGVGGQFNFVSQAFALEGARSIITLRSVREAGGRSASNIRWSYGHETVPRHYRDIVVTEYGVADLRGKPDREVIAAMLGIADSRYQPELLRAAKDARKIPADFEIPAAHRNNTPDRIARALGPLRARGLLPPFPFGTDFTDVEQRLIPALEILERESASAGGVTRLALRGLFASADAQNRECLARIGLAKPRSFADRAYRILVRAALKASAAADTIETEP